MRLRAFTTAVSRLGFAQRRAPLAVSVGIEFDRQPPAHWQAMLDAFAPPSDRTARLVIVWDAGDRWQPIGRWTILQCQPLDHLTPLEALMMAPIITALNGPHPRTDATLVYRLATVNGVTSLRPSLDGPYTGVVDRLTYETHRRLRAQGLNVYPRRFWVIQGTQGGQPFMLNSTEESLWGLLDKVHLAPAQRTPDQSAVLPEAAYADFDQRTLAAMRTYALVKDGADAGDPAKAIIARVRGLDLASNTARWAAHAETAANLGPALAHAMRKEGWHRLRHMPVGHRAPDSDLAEQREQFLNDYSLEALA